MPNAIKIITLIFCLRNLIFLIFIFVLQNANAEDTWVHTGKMPYTREPVPLDTLNAPFEFDVWLGTITESDGNVLRIFSMEDKSAGLRRDSTVYQSGNWEVFEIDDKLRETHSRTSWGTKALLKYDEKNRLTENYLINEKGDTLISECYIWGANGRLTQAIIQGEVNNFIYSTPCDSLIVEPPDWPRGDFNPTPMYNKSFGLIPEESDPEYEEFKMYPYAHFHITKELLERQKMRCEEYKKEQKKKGK